MGLRYSRRQTVHSLQTIMMWLRRLPLNLSNGIYQELPFPSDASLKP